MSFLSTVNRIYRTFKFPDHHTAMASASFGWRSRLKAASIHLGLSGLIAALAGLLVFGVWYPYPYREISGGRELFGLIVTVDVLLGPLITFAIFSRGKSWKVLRRDLMVVACLQLAALSYGLWTVYLARPVHMVFEIDRFSVVHAIDVAPESRLKAGPALQREPLWGPTLLAVRPFKDSSEKMEATLSEMAGAKLAARPDFWQPYESAIPRILAAAHPGPTLLTRFPQRQEEITAVLARLQRKPDDVVYMSLVSRREFWTILIDPRDAHILGFIPLDSF